jgi:hypothetical protein
MDLTRVWLFVAVGAFLLAGVLVHVRRERAAVRRDLERRGCRLLHLHRLPFRQGLPVRLGGPGDDVADVWGNVYRVSYRDRAGETLVAVCEMGPGPSVHWTAEHREPGHDRFGNPPNLSTYGNEWRG